MQTNDPPKRNLSTIEVAIRHSEEGTCAGITQLAVASKSTSKIDKKQQAKNKHSHAHSSSSEESEFSDDNMASETMEEFGSELDKESIRMMTEEVLTMRKKKDL